MRNTIILIASIVTLSSCLKKEIPIDKREAGDVVTNQTELGADYRFQTYYDFETNSFVGQNLKTDWDLGFETGEVGSRIMLNMANSMAAAKFIGVDFYSLTDTTGANWRYDVSSGNLDSTAIGDWSSTGGVYVLNRGYSYDGSHQGFRKLEINSVNSTSYTIKYANLDGSNEYTKTIEKQNTHNFTFLSFTTNAIATIQPPKDNWDLLFGQFTHLFEPTFPYLVTGIQSNRNGVLVARVYDKPFEDITSDDVLTYDFKANIDEIGYSWKTFTGSDYIVHYEKNYIVKTTEGFYYKIHFVDFYNQMGEKGTPVFEVQKL